MSADLARALVDRCDVILVDFDGPLCDVFANRPAPGVARQLEALTGRRFPTDDPMVVMRCAYKLDPMIGTAVEDALISAEIDAVRIAVPEMDGVRALRTWHDAGKKSGS